MLLFAGIFTTKHSVTFRLLTYFSFHCSVSVSLSEAHTKSAHTNPKCLKTWCELLETHSSIILFFPWATFVCRSASSDKGGSTKLCIAESASQTWCWFMFSWNGGVWCFTRLFVCTKWPDRMGLFFNMTSPTPGYMCSMSYHGDGARLKLKADNSDVWLNVSNNHISALHREKEGWNRSSTTCWHKCCHM